MSGSRRAEEINKYSRILLFSIICHWRILFSLIRSYYCYSCVLCSLLSSKSPRSRPNTLWLVLTAIKRLNWIWTWNFIDIDSVLRAIRIDITSRRVEKLRVRTIYSGLWQVVIGRSRSHQFGCNCGEMIRVFPINRDWVTDTVTLIVACDILTQND